MITFNEWLIEVASTRNLPYNTSGTESSPGNMSYGRQSSVPIYNRRNYNTDVSTGRRAEGDVRQLMIQHCGWFIRPGTAAEDTNYGIDGHVNINGHFYPAQIKRRTGGSDIGYMVGIDERPGQRPDQSPNPMDLLKSPSGRDKTMEARDMKSKAIYLFVVAGTQIMRVLAEEGKQLIRNSIAKWIGAIRQYPTRFSDGNVSLSLQWDNRDHYWKIMAYVRPQAFSSMQTCTIPNAATVNYPRHKGEGL